MIRISFRKDKETVGTGCPLVLRSCLTTFIALFITAVLAVVGAFCLLIYFSQAKIIIENQTGKEICVLTAVAPDGGTVTLRSIPPDKKISQRFFNSTEGGSVELIFKFAGNSQWYHARALGYFDHTAGGEASVILDEDTVHPLCCTLHREGE